MRRLPLRAVIVAVLLTLVAVIFLALASGNITAGGSGPTASAATVNGTGTPAPTECPKHFAQTFDPNTGGNFASDGVQTTDDELALMGRDARYLAFRAQDLGFVSSTEANPLLTPSNNCLSQEGQNTWNMVKGALTGVGVIVDTHAQAPANHYNTGMVNGHPVVDSQPGIGGDLSATKYTLRDGSVHYVLHRCGNLALAAQGSLPVGDTNHLRPPGVTVVAPPPTTSTPPSGCVRCVTTPPPPPGGCKYNCTIATKVPSEDPAPRGNAPVGGGRNEDPGPGRAQPYTPPPATPYTPPPAPTRDPGPPASATPVPNPQPAPPPEDGANPPDGGGNEGDPGGF